MAASLGSIGAIWGLGGVFTVLAFAIYRLANIAIGAFDFPFAWWHWVILVVNILFMAHSEGYKGFQKAYSPRVVARAQVIAASPTPLRVLLAPLFCMCFFDSTPRRLLATYLLTTTVIVLVLLFQQLAQPLRGVLDAGIVVGLTWGTVSIIVFAIRAFVFNNFAHPPELAGDPQAAH